MRKAWDGPGGQGMSGAGKVASVGGMTQLNGNTYTVQYATANTFALQGVDSSGYTTYTSGGTATFTNANFFDLVGSTFAGSYISGGTVLQYFAGVLAFFADVVFFAEDARTGPEVVDVVRVTFPPCVTTELVFVVTWLPLVTVDLLVTVFFGGLADFGLVATAPPCPGQGRFSVCEIHVKYRSRANPA
jgi:hypothetical protein